MSETVIQKENSISEINIEKSISIAWEKISPCWPLKNIIAVNPLQGFEHLSFEQALENGFYYFENNLKNEKLESINRETIKWLSVFLDQGQATIQLPLKNNDFYFCCKKLMMLDKSIHKNDQFKINIINQLSDNPKEAILFLIQQMNIENHQITDFLTLQLTTLPGWAGYIKYLNCWSDNNLKINESSYIAVRLLITFLLNPNAKKNLKIDIVKKCKNIVNDRIEKIKSLEKKTRNTLLEKITKNNYLNFLEKKYVAQFVFCIDVRSEPFRRQLESVGDYQTIGFAGFFGLPIQIANNDLDKSYPACPVLLKARCTVNERLVDHLANDHKNKKKINLLKQFYQVSKYGFTTPFILVELLGFFSFLWMGFKTISPRLSALLKSKLVGIIRPKLPVEVILDNENCVEGISFEAQCHFAESALKMMNLTQNFSQIIIFCGHGSITNNNAYASALDCGACGGHDGAPNARVLAAILNARKIRNHLNERGIFIPEDTQFLAALHNTATDSVEIFESRNSEIKDKVLIEKIRSDLSLASKKANQIRIKNFDLKNTQCASKELFDRSVDWAQTRPEWGLAGNAGFIIGPRSLTKNIDLEGRYFLHDYHFESDNDSAILKTILTAPMIVAQWINAQYLFSTINNIAFGSGSKITHNITGKIGIMQGNASDLMNGLPLQSLFSNDTDSFHEPIRLMVVVHAPRQKISALIFQESILNKLFSNGWVLLSCIDPIDDKIYQLDRTLAWI